MNNSEKQYHKDYYIQYQKPTNDNSKFYEDDDDNLRASFLNQQQQLEKKTQILQQQSDPSQLDEIRVSMIGPLCENSKKCNNNESSQESRQQEQTGNQVRRGSIKNKNYQFYTSESFFSDRNSFFNNNDQTNQDNNDSKKNINCENNNINNFYNIQVSNKNKNKIYNLQARQESNLVHSVDKAKDQPQKTPMQAQKLPINNHVINNYKSEPSYTYLGTDSTPKTCLSNYDYIITNNSKFTNNSDIRQKSNSGNSFQYQNSNLNITVNTSMTNAQKNFKQKYLNKFAQKLQFTERKQTKSKTTIIYKEYKNENSEQETQQEPQEDQLEQENSSEQKGWPNFSNKKQQDIGKNVLQQIQKKEEKQTKKTKGFTRLTKEQVLQMQKEQQEKIKKIKKNDINSINKEKEHLKTFIVQLQEVSQNIKELDYNDLKYNIMDKYKEGQTKTTDQSKIKSYYKNQITTYKNLKIFDFQSQKYIETTIEILEKEIQPIQTLKNYDINDKLDEIQRINQKYDILRQLIEYEASEENMKVYKGLQNIFQQILEKFLEFKQIVNSPFEKIKKPYSTKPTMSEIFSANKSNAGPQKTEKKSKQKEIYDYSMFLQDKDTTPVQNKTKNEFQSKNINNNTNDNKQPFVRGGVKSKTTLIQDKGVIQDQLNEQKQLQNKYKYITNDYIESQFPQYSDNKNKKNESINQNQKQKVIDLDSNSQNQKYGSQKKEIRRHSLLSVKGLNNNQSGNLFSKSPVFAQNKNDKNSFLENSTDKKNSDKTDSTKFSSNQKEAQNSQSGKNPEKFVRGSKKNKTYCYKSNNSQLDSDKPYSDKKNNENIQQFEYLLHSIDLQKEKNGSKNAGNQNKPIYQQVQQKPQQQKDTQQITISLF